MMKLLPVMFFVLSIQVYSQVDSSYSFRLPELKITQRVNTGKKEIFHFDKDKNKFYLVNNILKADTVLYKYEVNSQDILAVSFRNGSHFWRAAVVGASVGFFLGFVTGGYFDPASHGGSRGFYVPAALLIGAVAAIPFGLIGGLLGALTPRFEEYNMSKIQADYRRAYLIKKFKEYNIK